MSLASTPSAFSASITLAIACVFWSSASRAVLASVLTPVEMSTLSGAVLTAPDAASEMVRLSGWASASAGTAWSGAKARRDTSASVNFGEGRGMGIPEGDGTGHEDCLAAAEAQINFRQFAGPPNSAKTRNSATEQGGSPGRKAAGARAGARSSTG